MSNWPSVTASRSNVTRFSFAGRQPNTNDYKKVNMGKIGEPARWIDVPEKEPQEWPDAPPEPTKEPTPVPAEPEKVPV